MNFLSLENVEISMQVSNRQLFHHNNSIITTSKRRLFEELFLTGETFLMIAFSRNIYLQCYADDTLLVVMGPSFEDARIRAKLYL